MVRAGKSGARASGSAQRRPARKQGSQASPHVRGEQSQGRGAQSRVIRVIGGALRGRRWRFPDVPDIRPTPDRVRETLFNWLGSRIVGARCLDLFAGSGALGIESLSRGASQVVFVEQDSAAARALSELLAQWHVSGACVEREDAMTYLRRPAQPFDIVFLDPPFASDLLSPAVKRLEQGGWLSADALVYVECAARETPASMPPGWQPLKAKRAGEVGYHLFARKTAGAVPE